MGLDNCLASNRRQANNWANDDDDMIHWCIYSLLRHNKLTIVDISSVRLHSAVFGWNIVSLNLTCSCLPPSWAWEVVMEELSMYIITRFACLSWIAIQQKNENRVTIQIYMNDQLTNKDDHQHVGLFTKLIDSSSVIITCTIKGWLTVGIHKHFKMTFSVRTIRIAFLENGIAEYSGQNKCYLRDWNENKTNWNT